MVENSGLDRVLINRLTIVEEEVFNLREQVGTNDDSKSIEDQINTIGTKLDNYVISNGVRISNDETGIISNTNLISSMLIDLNSIKYNFTVGMSWNSFVSIFNDTNNKYVNIQPGTHNLTITSDVNLARSISVLGNGAKFNIGGSFNITFGQVELSNLDFGSSAASIILNAGSVAHHVYFSFVNPTGISPVVMHDCFILNGISNTVTSTSGLRMYNCKMNNLNGAFTNGGVLFMYDCYIIADIMYLGTSTSVGSMTLSGCRIILSSWFEIFNNDISIMNCNITVNGSFAVYRIKQNIGQATPRFKIQACRIVATSPTIDLFDFASLSVNEIQILGCLIFVPHMGSVGISGITYSNNYIDYSTTYCDANIISPVFNIAQSVNRAQSSF